MRKKINSKKYCLQDFIDIQGRSPYKINCQKQVFIKGRHQHKVDK